MRTINWFLYEWPSTSSKLKMKQFHSKNLPRVSSLNRCVVFWWLRYRTFLLGFLKGNRISYRIVFLFSEKLLHTDILPKTPCLGSVLHIFWPCFTILRNLWFLEICVDICGYVFEYNIAASLTITMAKCNHYHVSFQSYNERNN